MTGIKAVAASWATGTGVFVAQEMLPEAGVMEKLGVVAIVVTGAFYIVRYFMQQIAAKDALIERMMKENTAELVGAIRDGHDVKLKIADSEARVAMALQELTVMLRERR